jgi:hypothetical protein
MEYLKFELDRAVEVSLWKNVWFTGKAHYNLVESIRQNYYFAELCCCHAKRHESKLWENPLGFILFCGSVILHYHEQQVMGAHEA